MAAVDTDGVMVQLNGEIERMFGYRREELIGQSIEILVPKRLRSGHVRLREAFGLAPQQRPLGAGRELCGERKDGSEFPLEISLNPVSAGSRKLVLATLIDITERKRAEDGQKLLIGELHHRTQNLFAVIHSVARHSLTGHHPIAEARDLFINRLHSLSRSYAMLTDRAWQGAPLSQILAAELAAFSERVQFDGVDVTVRQSSAQSFALLFHELATNAVKFGALSVPEGRVRVHWRVEHDRQPSTFLISWTEEGGPPVAPPSRKGFGRKITEDIARQLGKYRVDYDPRGLRYELEMNLEHVGWLAEPVVATNVDD
jgi:PAS domain S-box-containing protein